MKEKFEVLKMSGNMAIVNVNDDLLFVEFFESGLLLVSVYKNDVEIPITEEMVYSYLNDFVGEGKEPMDDSLMISHESLQFPDSWWNGKNGVLKLPKNIFKIIHRYVEDDILVSIAKDHYGWDDDKDNEDFGNFYESFWGLGD